MKLHAIVVCFNPDAARVRALCERLCAAGGEVVLVDNTERSGLQPGDLPEGCALLSLRANTGIAHAQNVGIAHARARGARVVVFFDQDSMPADGFLQALVAPLQPGIPGVVGPVCRDEKTGSELPSTRLNRFGLPRPVLTGSARAPVAVDVIIASGSAATVETFDVAGGMDEALFIDFVDTEWCLRCRHHGVPVTVVPGAVLSHTLGFRSVQVGPLTVLVHGPLRCYYQIRNCFLLFRRKHVPRLFALRETASVILGRFLLLLFVPNRLTYIRAYLSAFRDGLRGKSGIRN